MRRAWQNLGSILLVVSFSSCGGNSETIVPVKGRLTFDGQPVPGVQIYFQPQQGRVSSGQTNQDGVFEMYFTRNRKGAQKGVHRVALTWEAPGSENAVQQPPPPAVRGLLKHLKANQPPQVEITKAESDLQLAFP